MLPVVTVLLKVVIEVASLTLIQGDQNPIYKLFVKIDKSLVVVLVKLFKFPISVAHHFLNLAIYPLFVPELNVFLCKYSQGSTGFHHFIQH